MHKTGKLLRKIKVNSKKYDGSLRDTYEIDLIEETDDVVTLFTKPSATDVWDYRKNKLIKSPDGMIEIYFKHRWFNVWHICEQISGINLMYINLATPCTLTNNCLEWVDLDLDYRVHLNGSVELLDEDEYSYNCKKMRYPDYMKRQVQAACQDIEQGLTRQVFPFNHQEQIERYKQIKNGLP